MNIIEEIKEFNDQVIIIHDQIDLKEMEYEIKLLSSD
jgi:hypothetical protein